MDSSIRYWNQDACHEDALLQEFLVMCECQWSVTAVSQVPALRGKTCSGRTLHIIGSKHTGKITRNPCDSCQHDPSHAAYGHEWIRWSWRVRCSNGRGRFSVDPRGMRHCRICYVRAGWNIDIFVMVGYDGVPMQWWASRECNPKYSNTHGYVLPAEPKTSWIRSQGQVLLTNMLSFGWGVSVPSHQAFRISTLPLLISSVKGCLGLVSGPGLIVPAFCRVIAATAAHPCRLDMLPSRRFWRSNERPAMRSKRRLDFEPHIVSVPEPFC